MAFHSLIEGKWQMWYTLIFIQEQDLIKKQISSKYLSVVFDGMTRLDEAMAIIVYYVDFEWRLQQRLISLQLLEKSMTGEEVGSMLFHLNI